MIQISNILKIFFITILKNKCVYYYIKYEYLMHKTENTNLQNRIEKLENDVLTLQNYISNMKDKLKNVINNNNDNNYPKGISKYTMSIIQNLIESFE